MAEQERLNNKQRRAKAREERRRKEAEAARRRKRAAIRNGVLTAVVVVVIASVTLGTLGIGPGFLVSTFGGGEELDDPILVSSSDVDDASQAAGCEVLAEREPLEEAGHFERNEAPPADLIYPEIRPTHSGPHTAQTYPPQARGSSSQIDERTSTHNLEHGAVIVWYDPAQVDEDTADEMGEWAGTLNDSGFLSDRGGGLVYVSPYEDPGISSGKAVALRAWGTAVDCDDWDETVGSGFVARHYGTRGIGPEAGFSPYPDGVLDITDGEADGEADDGADGDDADAGDTGDAS